MKKLRGILLVVLFGLPALASAEELKLGHFMAPRHVMHTDLMAPWAAELARATNNKLSVKIFPASQLGGKPPALEIEQFQ